MRITGGKARGILIKAPTGDTTRPATDRMREAIFSSLGPSVEGSRVADLFAGTVPTGSKPSVVAQSKPRSTKSIGKRSPV